MNKDYLKELQKMWSKGDISCFSCKHFSGGEYNNFEDYFSEDQCLLSMYMRCEGGIPYEAYKNISDLKMCPMLVNNND